MDINKLPTTVSSIEEFKNLFEEFGINSEKVRFYIGEYHLGPKAFGIYQENEDFIVYKVKDDGSTSIRYKGPDEVYACNELYQKFLEELSKRVSLSKKYNPYSELTYAQENKLKIEKIKKQREAQRKQRIFFAIFGGLFTVLFLSLVIYSCSNEKNIENDIHTNTHYYTYHNHYYSHYNDYWYSYNPMNHSWILYYPYINEYDLWDPIYDIDDYGIDEFDYHDYYNNQDHEDDYSNNNDTWESQDWSNDTFTDWGSDW